MGHLHVVGILNMNTTPDHPKSNPGAVPDNVNPVIKSANEIGNATVYLVFDTNVYMKHRFSLSQVQDIQALREECGPLVVIHPGTVHRECRKNLLAMLDGWKMPNINAEDKERLSVLRKKQSEVLRSAWKKWSKAICASTLKLPTSAKILRAAYRRLLEKRVPCHNKEEFRDAVIWETLLANAGKDHFLVFVTDNSKDFPYRNTDPGGTAISDFLEEVTRNKVLFFSTFNKFKDWVQPIRKKPPVRHEGNYSPEYFSDATRDFIEDHLHDTLHDYIECYDGGLEVIELSCKESRKIEAKTEITLADSASASPRTVTFFEKWRFTISFDLTGNFWVGGRDGTELSSSGSDSAAGVATIKRVIEVDDEGVLADVSTMTVEDIEIVYDNDWDPRDHFADHDDY